MISASTVPPRERTHGTTPCVATEPVELDPTSKMTLVEPISTRCAEPSPMARDTSDIAAVERDPIDIRITAGTDAETPRRTSVHAMRFFQVRVTSTTVAEKPRSSATVMRSARDASVQPAIDQDPPVIASAESTSAIWISARS
jgi:hypothetical protein